jgi:hypothetical protein
MSSNLWLSNATHRVFGWKDLLEQWDQTLQIPAQVKRVTDNLYAACDPNGTHDPRVSQFLTYMNYEQEGIAWFLYECISSRWVHGNVRVDYIRSLVDEIENLDGYFPEFPGSPQGQTIRQFVQANLETDELADVQMMPPLIQTPVRSARADYSYAQRAPVRKDTAPSPFMAPQVVRSLSQQFESLQPKPKSKKVLPPKHAVIQIHFIRNKKTSEDDVVSITQNSADSYNISYLDKTAPLKSYTRSVNRAAVINFLSLTLRLITVDEQPFESVQFTLPSMPAILVSPHNLSSQTRDLIYDSVEATMDFWPVYV